MAEAVLYIAWESDIFIPRFFAASLDKNEVVNKIEAEQKRLADYWDKYPEMRRNFEIEERVLAELSTLMEVMERHEDRQRKFHSSHGDDAPEPQIMTDIQSLIGLVATFSALTDYVDRGSGFWTDDNIRRLISNARQIACYTKTNFRE